MKQQPTAALGRLQPAAPDDNSRIGNMICLPTGGIRPDAVTRISIAKINSPNSLTLKNRLRKYVESR